MDPRPDPRDAAAGRTRLRATPRAAAPALALAVYVAAALALFAPAWRAPGRLAACGCGEAAFTMWFLRWTPYAVSHGHSPFLSAWLNVPDGVNAMWNVSFILPALALAPVTALGGPVLAYNVAAVASHALSAFTAYLVFRRWAPWWPAAFAGGLLFGFSPFMTSQSLGHVHMTLALFLPLFLLALDELLVRQRGRWALWGLLLGAVAAAQLLTAEEVLAAAALTGLVGVLVLVAVNPRAVRGRIRYAVSGLATALVSFALLAAWPLYVQFAGPGRLSGPVQQSERFSADLLAPFAPTRLMRFAPPALTEVSSHFTGNSSEKGAYLGLPLLLLLVAVTVLYRRLGVVRVAFGTLVGTFVLSLGRGLHVNGHTTDIALPLSWLRDVPLLQSVVASRMSLPVTLFAGLLLAVGLDRLHAAAAPERRDQGAGSPLRRGLQIAGPVTLAVAVLLPMLPARPFPARPVDIPSWFSSASVKRVPPGSVLLTVPVPSRVDSRPMLWQAAAGMRYRSPGGYVLTAGPDGRPRWGSAGTTTTGFLNRIRLDRPTPRLDAGQLRVLRSDLARWRVRTVVIPVGGMAHYDKAVALFTDVLARPPVRDQNAFVWYGVDAAASGPG